MDLDIHGTPVSNKNKSLFLGFLDYSGLTFLNKKFCFGIPTYEIPRKRRSIIDFALTNSEKLVDTFEILQKTIGVSPQSCHKILRMSILLSVPIIGDGCPDRVNFNSIRSKKSLYLSHILASLENFHRLKIGVDYNIVQRIYGRAKNDVLGNFVSHKKKSKTTLAMR